MYSQLECFKDDKEEYDKFKNIWKILTAISEGFRKANKTKDENENLAKKCEEFGKTFPIYFERNLTRKMHTLTITIPYLLRNNGK